MGLQELQLHRMDIVVQGFICLIVVSVTEPRTPTIVLRNSQAGCNPPCDNTSGMFCLLRQCIRCGFCPKDPFDLDPNGYLDIYTPCIQNGFCPRVCSSYSNLGSYPLANETFCEEINATKETTTTTTTVTSTTDVVVETATTRSGVTPVKPDAGPTTTKHPVIYTNIGQDVLLQALPILIGASVLVVVVVGLGYFFKKHFYQKRPGSSTCSSTATEDTSPLINETLEIQLNDENRTVTVKGLERLNCNALQLCACLYVPDRPDQNWMLTNESDEVQLQGVMIPHQVYTVKAGTVTRGEFGCIAEGRFNTEEFSNVTLDEECSTAIANIFTDIALRRSLQTELYQPVMTDVIASAFDLKGDSYLHFKHKQDLEKLYSETLTTSSEVVDGSIHPMMERLAQNVAAKDFVRKIAKRGTTRDNERNTQSYCKKCLEILHRMCCRSLDESIAVDIDNLPI